MRSEQITELLLALGCRQIRTSGNKVLATCPFEHEHSSGRDSHPSFVVFAGDDSKWNCSYPHSSQEYSFGSMEELVRHVARLRRLPTSSTGWGNWEDNGVSLHSLYRFVWMHDSSHPKTEHADLKSRLNNADWSPARAHAGRFSKAANTAAPPPETQLPDNYLERFEFPDGKAWQYLHKTRGLDRGTIEQWELLYDPDWKRVVIPVRDVNGKLIAISRRALHDWQKPKYMHSKGFQRRHYLFGENPQAREPATRGKQRGILVEGQFDVIRLWQYGYRNAVAIFGADMTKEQLDKCQRMFSEVVVMTDGDAAGRTAGEKILEQLAAYNIPSRVAVVPDNLDPGDVGFTVDHARELIGSPDIDSQKFPWE